MPWISPTNPMQVEIRLFKWQEKIQKKMEWNDHDQRAEFDAFVESTRNICTEAMLIQIQLSTH